MFKSLFIALACSVIILMAIILAVKLFLTYIFDPIVEFMINDD